MTQSTEKSFSIDALALDIPWLVNLKYFSYNSVFTETSLSILKDENLQWREKAIFTIFSVVKFFEHNITYCKLVK